MDIQRFLKLLLRYWWILIVTPVAAASITYYLAQDLPKEYKSEALISTGLADHSQQSIGGGSQMDYFALNQQFTNIIEFLEMKKNLNTISYKLILHDLENPTDAFHSFPEELAALDSSKRNEIISEYKKFLAEKRIITPDDNGKYALYDYLQLMGYGEGNIKQQLEITRKDNSDFIQVEFVSDNPYLSAYVVNTVAHDFIHSFKERAIQNKNNSKEVLDSLVRGKESSMNAINSQIRDFQVKNSVIDLGNQAEQTFEQIGEKDALRAKTVSEIQSLEGAIRGIEEKLKSSNAGLMSASANENKQAQAIRAQLQKANERYVANNFKPEDARVIDSLQMALSRLNASNPVSANTGTDPKLLRQTLNQQKLLMEVELDKAKSSLAFILSDLAQLRAKFERMVPNNAGMKNYEREAEVATKEYLSALELYNQNNVVNSTGINPQLAQEGVINPAEPSKKIIYTGLSGVGSFGTCIFIFAIAFLLDGKVRTSEQLASTTRTRIIGQINTIVPNDTDLKTVWEEGKSTTDYSLYKDLIRSLRFEIDASLKEDGKQIFGVTGLYNNSGSSFISSSLAYSFAMTKKKVLLIGGDYVLDRSKVKEIKEGQFFDSYIVKREIKTEEFITKLNTNAKNESLLEVYNEDTLKKGFDELKKEFDIIIVDVQSLQKVHRAKEWLMFVDKSVAVFPAGAKVGSYEKELITFMNKQNGFIGWILNKTKTSDLGMMKLIASN